MSDGKHGSSVPEDESDRTEMQRQEPFGDLTLDAERRASAHDPSVDDERSAHDDDATMVAPVPESPGDLPSDLPPNIGKYKILGKLGEGGMGVVLEAEQQNPRRRVALKVIRGGQLVDDDQIRMFKREADTLALLKHANIGAIYESGHTEGGRHFFAMELVRGKTLDDYLEERPQTLDRDELQHRLELFRKIADAVHYAHQRGVIHRDLKPSNIVVPVLEDEEESASGAGIPEIKILDFGLARITEGDLAAVTMQTEVGLIKGTLPYMSPEQARGVPEEIDLRTDVYALGVILYEILTGQRPYDTQQGSLIEAVRVIHEEPPKPLRHAWSGRGKVDEDLETIVGKALEKDADDRYGSAAALAEDIGRYLTSQPILARPPSTVYQLKKLVARNKLGTAFVATVLLLLIGFGVWMSLLWRQSEAARTRAEASKLLALGRVEFGTSPSSALAYSMASLELDDDPATRRFALEALWRGPTARVARQTPTLVSRFLESGHRLGLGAHDFTTGESAVALLAETGVVDHLLATGARPPVFVGLGRDGSRVFAQVIGETLLRAWTLPEGVSTEPPDFGAFHNILQSSDQRYLLTVTQTEEGAADVRQWDSGSLELVRQLRISGRQITDLGPQIDVDPGSEWLGWVHEGRVQIGRLADLASAAPRSVGHHTGAAQVVFHPTEPVVVSVDFESGELRFWSMLEDPAEPIRTLVFDSIMTRPRFDATGRYLAMGGGNQAWIWDLEGPTGAAPVVLERSDSDQMMSIDFHPHAAWLVTADQKATTLWSLAHPWPLDLPGHENRLDSLAFDPRGRWLVSSTGFEVVPRFWALEAGGTTRSLASCPCRSLATDASGERLAAVVDGIQARLYESESDTPTVLGEGDFWEVAISRDGRYVAASGGQFVPENTVVTVWDLDTGEEIVLDAGDTAFVIDVEFLSDNRVIGSGDGGVRLWDLETQEFEQLAPGPTGYVAVTPDDRRLLVLTGEDLEMRQGGRVVGLELGSGETRELSSHGSEVNALAIDSSGTMIATGDTFGVVRYGSIDGDEPHLLLRHPSRVESIAIDPRGRWIASGDTEGLLRLWPVPEGEPFHALPHRQFLDRLAALTNYRVVADASAPDGYRLEVGPFEGWQNTPTW